jgi:N-methylhydantoinase B
VLPMVVDTILHALADAIPDRVPAAHFGLMGNQGLFFGMNPVTRRRFVVRAAGGGGWGGRPFEDGESAACTVCQGDVRNSSIEEMEMKAPIYLKQRTLRRDSGGPGKFRGGLGTTIHVKNLVEGRWNLGRPLRQQCPPWGLRGGEPGHNGVKMLRTPEEKDFREVNVTRYLVPAETEVLLHTGTGGGYGNPLEREPERVQWDVTEGLVSPESAKKDYGVVIRADLSIDDQATQALRREMAKEAA